jgi:hypothetical protein
MSLCRGSAVPAPYISLLGTQTGRLNRYKAKGQVAKQRRGLGRQGSNNLHPFRERDRVDEVRNGLRCQLAPCHGCVHFDELHYGCGFNMREAFEGSHFIGEVLVDRTIIRTDQRGNQVG